MYIYKCIYIYIYIYMYSAGCWLHVKLSQKKKALPKRKNKEIFVFCRLLAARKL